MKKLATLILLFVFANAASQDLNKMQKQIDSLKTLKADYESKIQQINTVIKELENSKVITSYEKFESFKYIVPNQPLVRIRDKDNSSGNILFEPKNGEIITLIDFDDSNDYWLVSFKDITGYVNDVLILQSTAIKDFKKYLIAKNEQKAKEDEQISIENAKKAAEVRKLEAQKLEEKRKLEAQRNQEEAKKIALEVAKKAQVRKIALTKKYGAEIAEKIVTKKIWIGMTSEMAKESWGYPEDINRSVGSWGVHEQWVYSDDTYLYFENGVLTSWQD